MTPKLSVGSWAYAFGPYTDNPVDFRTVCRKLNELGLDGVELGGFKPHPGPDSCATPADRQELRRFVADQGLAFSALAADLWAYKLLTTDDAGPYLAAFAKNVQFAKDLGIDCIRVDTVEPITVLQEGKVEPKVAFDRVVSAFDRCSKMAADQGIKICWEFEPGFPFNKPSEVVALVDAVRGLGNPNFGVLYDSCHAHMSAAVGANQIGEKETLPGGALEMLHLLKGKINHVHLIDSDDTLNEHNTSTHAPFGMGHLDFDTLLPEIQKAGIPTEWWCVDLCFWPDAWNFTEQSKKFLDGKLAKMAA